ncbi:MAG TPA: hypothetical protein VGS19_12245 [Streptosporangiaceae bacterium]|nr:hypothetical protein [Streptosporangiaceae bacterium]
MPTTDGQLTVTVATLRLALLTWVPGHPLTRGDRGQREPAGTTLAQVHRALADYRVDEADRFHWVNPDATHLSVRPRTY